MSTTVEFVQKILKSDGFYEGPISGICTVGTVRAANLAGYGPSPPMGNIEPALVRIIQLRADAMGLSVGPIDGLMGPRTRRAMLVLEERLFDEPTAVAEHNLWPTPGTREFEEYWGKPGEHNLVMVRFPYKMYYGGTQVSRTQCHRKVAESFQGALEQVKQDYDEASREALHLDQYSGGYNYRKKRGGSQLSMHAYGIAFDFDAPHNRLHWNHKKARFAADEYKRWWLAWIGRGWKSLGKSHDFDWMHVQATC